MAAGRMFRFGVFELDARTGELWKSGVKQKLQGKPFQVLLALLEKPGDLVTRDELQRQLWPSDVFVDFDSGLNTAINGLRFVLGESAEHPHYIETFARTGYRFIAPVDVVDVDAIPAAARAQRNQRLRLAALGSIVVLVATVVLMAVAIRRPRADAFQFRQVTFRRGQVWGARFAPDGHAILYTQSIVRPLPLRARRPLMAG